ncbi:MAG: sugar phosphate isomerase/epimerase [Clostridia bacterium]|nr:sugar phosphate isomerase/epimerase [Clostridia bacterium]MBN2882050.1 sugar phosphate isomerase/epimerase [Clostridia bacterium]
MRNFKISAQLYTLRKYTQTPEGLLDTLKKIKEIGYKSFQLSGAGPMDPAYIRKCLDETGLVMSATHTSPQRLKEDLDSVIREHKLWNCEFVGVGMMPEEYRDDYAGIVRFSHEYDEIGRKLKANGLTLIYHNHDFEFQKFDDKLIMDILMDETNPRSFEFEIDTYWVQSGGGNPEDWIYKMDGRMRYIHFKDMAMDGRKQIFAPVGEGNLNWEKIITACEETKVEWCAIEQDTCMGNEFDALRQSYENLTITYGMED